jgi:UrcA family protein
MQTYIPIALALIPLSAPSVAQEVKVGPDRYAVTLAVADLQASTPALARGSLHRIDRAATAVCGASGGNLREVTQAVRSSACWRDAVTDTVRRIDAPLLSQAWQDRR